jgi:hypothetical protein
VRKALGLLWVAATACSAISTTMGNVTGSTQKKQAKVELRELQYEVMRFADDYVTAISLATGNTEGKSPEARLELITWRLHQATGAYDIASGPVPLVNAVDMAVLVTLTRRVAERYWAPKVFGESGRPVLEALRRLEPRAWQLIPPDAEPGMIANVRQQIIPWLDRHPDVRDVAFVRALDLSSDEGPKAQAGLGSMGDVLGAAGVDPLGGLDATERQIEESRILGERSVYYAKRMPNLLDLQAQKMALELTLQPASQQVLADTDRVSRAAESVGRLAGAVPALVDRQREAAIRQVLDGLEVHEGKAERLLTQLKGTLEAGTETASSLERVTASVQALIGRTSAPAASPAAGGTSAAGTGAGPTAGAPPSKKPFDVDDYTRALAQLGDTTADLQRLLESLDRTAPRVEALLDRAARQASMTGEALADHLFWRAVALIGVILVGGLGTALTYRWATKRLLA